jgi:hypothetical protein
MPPDDAPAPGAPLSPSPFHQGVRPGVTPPSETWRGDGPGARHERDQRVIDDERGRGAGHVHTRAPDGTPLIDGKPTDQMGRRTQSAATTKPDDKPSDNRLRPLSDVGKPGAMVRLSDDLEVPESEYREVAAEIAARKAGTASAPGTADQYRVELPKDFEVPVGAQPFKFDDKSPLVASAKELAAKHHLSQDALTDFAGLYAREQVEAQTRLRSARVAEEAKLGPMVTERMSAINRFLEGKLGKALAEPLQASIWTAAAARSWEALITKLASSGSGYSNIGRDGGDGRRISDAVYESWSSGQRLNYARTGDPDRAI